MHFLKLPKILTNLEFAVIADTSLSAVKEHLLQHRETLRILSLVNLDCDDTPRGDILGDLGEFSALRQFKVDANYILHVEDTSTSLASLLPEGLRSMGISLNNADDNDICDIYAELMVEVVQNCLSLEYLYILGYGVDYVGDIITDECDRPDLELDIEIW
jgi:hypothetical protein